MISSPTLILYIVRTHGKAINLRDGPTGHNKFMTFYESNIQSLKGLKSTQLLHMNLLMKGRGRLSQYNAILNFRPARTC